MVRMLAAILTLAFLVAGCTGTEDSRPSDGQDDASPSEDRPVAEDATSPLISSPSESVTPGRATTPDGEESVEELFQALPTVRDVEAWGLVDLEDARYGGERVNGVFRLADASAAQAAIVRAGGRTAVNPRKCAALSDLVHPQEDSLADLIGLSWYENTTFAGESYAFVQLVTWPSSAQAESSFLEAASVADDCGEFAMLTDEGSSTIRLWKQSPKITETWLRGIEQSKGTLLGVKGRTTYQVIVLSDEPRKVLTKANRWLQGQIM